MVKSNLYISENPTLPTHIDKIKIKDLSPEESYKNPHEGNQIDLVGPIKDLSYFLIGNEKELKKISPHTQHQLNIMEKGILNRTIKKLSKKYSNKYEGKVTEIGSAFFNGYEPQLETTQKMIYQFIYRMNFGHSIDLNETDHSFKIIYDSTKTKDIAKKALEKEGVKRI